MSLEGNITNKQTLEGDLSAQYGTRGQSAYEVAVSLGFEGTEEEWLASLKGEKGDTGNTGNRGNTIVYATNSNAVESNPNSMYGTNHRIAIKNISPRYVSTFMKGDIVICNSMQYLIVAYDNEYAYLNYPYSIRGAKGDKGKTAYEYAQDGGFEGTEEEFADKLAQEYIAINTSYGETDRYYFEGLEERLVLANYGITLPFDGITSAYKLKAEITKEQLATITSIRLASYVNWDIFRFDLTKPLYESNDGSVFSLGSLGIAIIGFTQGAILPITIGDMTLNVPIPSKGIFMVIPDENYNLLANNYVLYITGGIITANKYTQIDNKYLYVPDINLDIPDEIGYREDKGIRMRGASETYDRGFSVGSGAKALNVGAFALGGDCITEGYDAKSMGTRAHALGDNSTALGYFVWARGNNSTVAGGFRNEADGDSAFVTNRFNSAKGYASAAFGDGNYASGSKQFVTGKNNVEDTQSKYANIVGGGTSNTDRKNIHTLDWNGNAWFSGGVELTSPNGTRYRITIGDNANLIIERLNI